MMNLWAQQHPYIHTYVHAWNHPGAHPTRLMPTISFARGHIPYRMYTFKPSSIISFEGIYPRYECRSRFLQFNPQATQVLLISERLLPMNQNHKSLPCLILLFYYWGASLDPSSSLVRRPPLCTNPTKGSKIPHGTTKLIAPETGTYRKLHHP